MAGNHQLRPFSASRGLWFDWRAQNSYYLWRLTIPVYTPRIKRSEWSVWSGTINCKHCATKIRPKFGQRGQEWNHSCRLTCPMFTSRMEWNILGHQWAGIWPMWRKMEASPSHFYALCVKWIGVSVSRIIVRNHCDHSSSTGGPKFGQYCKTPAVSSQKVNVLRSSGLRTTHHNCWPYVIWCVQCEVLPQSSIPGIFGPHHRIG